MNAADLGPMVAIQWRTHRRSTLIWMFVGGAMVTFAVNGLIAWAPSFMQRVHEMTPVEVGRNFGLLALGGAIDYITRTANAFSDVRRR